MTELVAEGKFRNTYTLLKIEKDLVFPVIGRSWTNEIDITNFVKKYKGNTFQIVRNVGYDLKL